MNEDDVVNAVAAMADSISEKLASLSESDRGTALANLTLSLFRTCERDLTEESMERLMEAIESDEDDKDRRVH